MPKFASDIEPRSVKVSVIFEAVVLAVEKCTIDGETVQMSRAGAKWTGDTAAIPSSKAKPFLLRFRAPSHTDYEVTIKARKKSILEASGTSDKTTFTIEEDLTVPLASEA